MQRQEAHGEVTTEKFSLCADHAGGLGDLRAAPPLRAAPSLAPAWPHMKTSIGPLWEFLKGPQLGVRGSARSPTFCMRVLGWGLEPERRSVPFNVGAGGTRGAGQRGSTAVSA